MDDGKRKIFRPELRHRETEEVKTGAAAFIEKFNKPAKLREVQPPTLPPAAEGTESERSADDKGKLQHMEIDGGTGKEECWPLVAPTLNIQMLLRQGKLKRQASRAIELAEEGKRRKIEPEVKIEAEIDDAAATVGSAEVSGGSARDDNAEVMPKEGVAAKVKEEAASDDDEPKLFIDLKNPPLDEQQEVIVIVDSEDEETEHAA